MKNLIKNIISQVKFYWWFKGLYVYERLFNMNDSLVRKNFCHYGFHKLKMSFIECITWENNKRKRIRIDFLACPFCNYKFFTTKKDKEKYLSLTAKENSVLAKAFSGLSRNDVKEPVKQ